MSKARAMQYKQFCTHSHTHTHILSLSLTHAHTYSYSHVPCLWIVDAGLTGGISFCAHTFLYPIVQPRVQNIFVFFYWTPAKPAQERNTNTRTHTHTRILSHIYLRQQKTPSPRGVYTMPKNYRWRKMYAFLLSFSLPLLLFAAGVAIVAVVVALVFAFAPRVIGCYHSL